MTSVKMATRFYRSAQVVLAYMKQTVQPTIRPLLKPTDREKTAYGLYLRALGWMQTIKKLNDPADFQALVSGTRALFETNIDMILIRYDESGARTEQEIAWGESAKLKQAEALVAYYRSIGKPVPPQYKAHVEFIRTKQQHVQQVRVKHWPSKKDPAKGRHPDRWSDANLAELATEADKLHGSELREFYETEYRAICWNTHGSGLAAVRTLPPETFHAICGLAFRSCADFGMDCAKLALMTIGRVWQKDLKVQQAHGAADLQRDVVAAQSQV